MDSQVLVNDNIFLIFLSLIYYLLFHDQSYPFYFLSPTFILFLDSIGLLVYSLIFIHVSFFYLHVSIHISLLLLSFFQIFYCVFYKNNFLVFLFKQAQASITSSQRAI